jgi:hypothetical protein
VPSPYRCQANPLSPKFFQGLLQGLSKLIFYEDENISMQLLREQVYSGSEWPEEGAAAPLCWLRGFRGPLF